MAILISEVEQYQYGDNGVLLNGPAALPFVDITSVQGLDSGEFRESDFQRDEAHGSWIDAYYQAARTVTLEGTLYADPNNLEPFLDSLKANFAPTAVDLPLYFRVDGNTDVNRCVFGKSLGISYNKDSMRRIGSSAFQIQIKCGDPRIYSQSLSTISVSWGSGSATLTLSGNRPSPGLLLLNGPLTNPAVTHTPTGTTFSFPSFSVSSGQSIAIDLNKRTVLQGSINRRSSLVLSGNWPELVPGSNPFNRSGSGSGTFTVQARSAWW